MTNLQTEISQEFLNEKIQEAALAGAEKAINEFYKQWDSPFQRQIKTLLEEQSITPNFNTLNLAALLNEKISQKFDESVNQIIAMTYLPVIDRLMTGAPKKIKFSKLLIVFIKQYIFDDYDSNDFTIEKDESFSYWNKYKIKCRYENDEYIIYLNKKEGKYYLNSVPSKYTQGFSKERMMKVSKDGVNIEIPITTELLKDDFLSFCASCFVNNTEIEMDTEDFPESLED